MLWSMLLRATVRGIVEGVAVLCLFSLVAALLAPTIGDDGATAAWQAMLVAFVIVAGGSAVCEAVKALKGGA